MIFDINMLAIKCNESVVMVRISMDSIDNHVLNYLNKLVYNDISSEIGDSLKIE
jgi:hypothetical protein